MTWHHRKPESKGGTREPRNMSWVRWYLHQAWTILFDNHDAPKVAELFAEYDDIFSTDKVRSNREKRRIREWIRAKKSRKNKKRAWETLYRGMSRERRINYTNSVWLDPDYELFIEIETVRKIYLRTRRF